VAILNTVLSAAALARDYSLYNRRSYCRVEMPQFPDTRPRTVSGVQGHCPTFIDTMMTPDSTVKLS
jgi:hypothetical protein